MPNSPRTFFIFSLEPWSFMWYSKHHYAAFLARKYGVYFVSVPDRWRWRDLFSFGVKVSATRAGVNVVEYRNNLPLRMLPPFMARWVNILNSWKLSRLPGTGEAVFWCFHPTPLPMCGPLKRMGHRIYHVVDPYQIFPSDPGFARQADVVVAINPWFRDHYLQLNPNTILIPHGVRDKDREHDPDAVATFQAQWGRYFVMAASINYRTNYALLIRVARRFPGYRLVLVGPMAPLQPDQQDLRDRLLKMSNVVHAGVRHPDDLRNIIKGAVAGLVTYDFEPTKSLPDAADGTPLKVITYLAQHCPVVSTINSYVPVLDGMGNFKAEDAPHFLELLGQVAKGTLVVDQNVVDSYLDSVSYQRLTATILDKLPPAPVVTPAPPATRPAVPPQSPVLIISNEGWDGPRYSKHRYALALQHLRPVFFLDPARPWRPTHPFRWRIVARRTEEGITVLSYHNVIPLLGGRLRWVNDRIIAFRLKKFLERRGGRRPLVWTFDPSRLANPAQLAPFLSVYHCVDDYAFGWGERALARHSDHVFCIAHDLMSRFRPYNTSIHYVPHGLSDNDLDPSPPASGELPLPPGYGLYIGNINDRHDFALWKKLFDAQPDINWLVVGPVNVRGPEGMDLVKGAWRPHVFFLGQVPYHRLRSLIAGAAFGFCYLRPDHPANRISSQKMVQFLALGKPFFCSWFSEYADKRDLVYMADDHAAALANFNLWRLQGEDAEVAAKRRAFAEGLRFSNLLDQLPFRW